MDSGQTPLHWHPALASQLAQLADDPAALPPEWQAFLAAANADYHRLEAERAQLAQTLATQRDDLRQANEALAVLHDIAHAALEMPDLQATLQMIADRLGALFAADACFITLWDAPHQRPVPSAAYGPARERYPLVRPGDNEITLTHSVLTAQHALIIDDALNSPHLSPHIAVEFQASSLLALPLIAREQPLGAAIISFTQPHVFTPAEVALGERVAGQVALAVAKAHAFETERQQRQLAEAMREASTALTGTLDFNSLLDKILDELKRVLPYDSANVMLFDAQRRTLRMTRHRGYEQFGVVVLEDLEQLEFDIAGAPLLRQVLESGQPCIVADAQTDPDWVKTPAGQHVGSWAGAPVLNRGEVIAILSADKVERNFYQPIHLERLADFAGQVALAIHNAQLYEAVRQQSTELEIIRQVNLSLTSSLQFKSVFNAILQSAFQVVAEAHDTHIFLYDGQRLSFGAARWFDGRSPALNSEPRTDGITATVARSGDPLIIPDLRRHPLAAQREGALASFPLKSGARVVGVMNVACARPHSFSESELRILRSLGDQAAIAIENARLFAAAEKRAAELEAVRQMSLSLTSNLELGEVLDIILKHVLRLAPDVHDAHLYLYHADQLRSGAARMADGSSEKFPEPRPQGFTYTVARSGKPFVVSDLKNHPLFAGTGRTEHGALIGLPLLFGSRVVGVLNVAYTYPRQFEVAELRLLSLVADQSASAIEGARLFEAARRQLQELSALHAIALASASLTEESDLLTHATGIIAHALHASQCGFIMVDETGAHPALLAPDPLAGPGLVGEVIATGRPQRAGAVSRGAGTPAGSVLGVPLLMGRRVIGVINVESDQPEAFTDTDEQLVFTIAGQLAMAVERLRLFENERRRSTQLRIAHELTQSLSTVQAPEMAARLVAEKLAEEFNYPLVTVFEVDEKAGQLILLVAAGTGAQHLSLPYQQPLTAGVFGRAARTRLPQLVADPATDPDFIAPAGWQVASEACVPLVDGEQVVAVLGVDARPAFAFAEHDLVLLQMVGREILHAWERIRLFAAEREQRTQAETLRDVATALNVVLDREQTLIIILDQLARVVPYDSASIMLLSDTLLDIVAQRGFEAETQIHVKYQVASLAHIQQVLQTAQPVILADTQTVPGWQVVPGTAYIRCWLGVPLVTNERVMGLINLDYREAGFYTLHHAQLAVAFSYQAAAALERLRLLEEARQHEREMATLLDVARAVASTLDLNEMTRQVALALARALRVAHCEISTYAAKSHTLTTRAIYAEAGAAAPTDLGRVRSLPNFQTLQNTLERDEILILRLSEADNVEADRLRRVGATLAVIFPVRAGGHPVGLAELYTADPLRDFTPADLRLARALGDQAGVALENARLFEAEREQHELAEALREVGASLGATLDVAAVLDRLIEQVTRVAPCDAANVVLVENGRGHFVRARGYEQFDPDLPREILSLTLDITTTPNLAQMAQTRQPYLIADTATHPGWMPTGASAYLHAWVGAPIILQTEGVAAFVSLEKIEPDFYHSEHIARLAAFAGQAALALQNARLFAAQQQRAAELEAVRQTSLILTSTLDLPIVLQTILKSAFQQMHGAQDAYIFLYNATGSGQLTFGATLWDREREDLAWEEPLPDELTHEVARTGEMLVVANPRDNPWLATSRLASQGAVIGLPLKIGQRVVGVMILTFSHAHTFPEAELWVLRLLADQAAVAIENARLFAEAQRKTKELAGLYDTLLAVGGVLDTQVLLARLYEQVSRLLAADTFAVILHHPAAGEIEVALMIEYGQRLPVVRLPLTKGGFHSWVINTRKALLVGDVQVNPLPIETQYLKRPARAWLGVPLSARDQILGVVSVQSDRPYAFNEADQQFLEAISGQVAISLENAQLYAETQRRLTEQMLLYECTQDLLLTQDINAAMAAVSGRMVNFIGASDLIYYTYDEATDTLRAEYEFQADATRPPRALVGQVWALNDYPRLAQVLQSLTPLVTRYTEASLTPLERDSFIQHDLRATVSVPVALHGRAIGYFELWDNQIEREYRDSDLRLLTAIATQTAAALQNATLYTAVRANANELSRLYAAAQDMGASLEPQVVLEQLAKHLTEGLNATSGYITEVNWGEEALTILAEYWSEAASPSERISDLGRVYFLPDFPSIGKALTWGNPASFSVTDADLSDAERAQMLEYGAQSSLIVPILSRGHVLGAAEIWESRRVREFTAADYRLAQLLVRQAAGLIENAQLFGELADEKRRLELLYSLSQGLTATLDVREVALRAIDQISPAFGAFQGTVFFIQPDSSRLHLLAVTATVPERTEEIDRLINLHLGEGLAGWAAAQRKVSIAVDVSRDPHWAPVPGFDDEVRSSIAIPLIVGDKVMGVFSLHSNQRSAFNTEQIPLLTASTASVAAALQNARLFEAEARRARDLALLNDITRASIEITDLRAMLQKLAERLGDLLAADACYISLWDEQLQIPVPFAASGAQQAIYPAAQPHPDEVTLTASVLQVGHSLAVEDAYHSPYLSPSVAEQAGAQSMLGLALMTANQKLGAAIIAFQSAHHFSPAEIERAEHAANQIALGIERNRLFTETAEALAREQRLNEVARAVSAALDVHTIIRSVVRLAVELVGADAGTLALVAPTRDLLQVAFVINMPAHLIQREVPRGEGVSWQIIDTGQPLLLDNYPTHPQALPVWVKAGAHAFIGVPVIAGDVTLGVLGIFSLNAARHFNKRDLALIESVGRQAGVAIQNARLFEETRRQAEEVIAASEILRTLNASPEVTTNFGTIAAGLKTISQCERVSLALLDVSRQRVTITALDQPRPEMSAGTQFPITSTAAAEDVLAGQPHRTPDLATEINFPAERQLYEAGFRSRLNLPLRAGADVLGALNLVWTTLEGYRSVNLTLLSQIADALALAVEKNRLFTETHRRAEELEILAEISAALRVAASTTEIMEIALGRSLAIFHAARGAIAVPGPDAGTLVIAHEQGWSVPMRQFVYHQDDSIFGHVFATGHPYLTLDWNNDPLVHQVMRDAWAADQPDQKLTAIYAPLRAGAEVIGILIVADDLPRLFTGDNLNLLNAIAEIAGSAFHRAGVLETLEQRVAERTQELATANERLKELDRLRDQFVSNVSHELRTPLTNIKLHLGMLERRGPEAMQRYLPILQKETERLRKLIEDLLDISRLRAQISSLKTEPHRLDVLLSEIVTFHLARAEGKGVSLHYTSEPNLPEVPVDRAQIIQVFTNLVSNAVAYTPAGGSITITAASEAEGVALRFNNSAPIIAPEDLAHLFERFYRGATGRDSGEPGTGLGLAICKEIVERHAGMIHVTSTAENGTTFTMWLSLKPPSESD